MFALIIMVIAIIVSVVAIIVTLSAKESETKVGSLATMGVAWLIVIVVGAFSAFFTVGAGEVGVRFDPLGGGVKSSEYQEGLHIKAPWVSIDTFNTKTQEFSMTSGTEEGVRTVTKEGLYVDLDITVLYRINSINADVIRQEIGKEGQYQVIAVRPNIRSVIREVVSRYEASYIYGDGRDVVSDEVRKSLTVELEPRNIIVESVLLRDVGLPTLLTTAIEEKKQAEQDALRMEYVLLEEAQEKERKIIEAEGIAQANIIISDGLTNEYLTWYWIDNLQNHNSVIYVPIGEDGLPMFKEVD